MLLKPSNTDENAFSTTKKQNKTKKPPKIKAALQYFLVGKRDLAVSVGSSMKMSFQCVVSVK